ncbi:MAG: hypothetical protein FWG90_03690 [Oscillospiraceae bacterium]|nr:hypothetical protein [Oscillospiraceae bacterium]
MKDPIEILIDSFNSINIPVYMQGALKGTIPRADRFFTYWILSSKYEDYYDNHPMKVSFQYSFFLYSKNLIECLPLNASETVNEILLPAGFKTRGAGRSNGYFNSEYASWVNEYSYTLKFK